MIGRIFLSPSSADNLGGHSKEVQKPRFNKLRVGFHFSHRVFNALPELALSAPLLNILRRSWTFIEEKTVGINTSPPICCLYNWWQWILHIETECSGHSRYSLTLSFCNCCWDLRSSNNIVWFELKISYFSHILTKPVSHLVLKLFISDTNTILRNIISLLI